jgi:hypothetical protein
MVAKARPLRDPTVTTRTFHIAGADRITDMSGSRVARRPKDAYASSIDSGSRSVPRKEPSMTNKPKSERSDERPTGDDIARASLGGSRGSSKLPPAQLDEKGEKDMPRERNDDPGHTA